MVNSFMTLILALLSLTLASPTSRLLNPFIHAGRSAPGECPTNLPRGKVPWVVEIFRNHRCGERRLCRGVYIGGGRFLTAAHCLLSREPRTNGVQSKPLLRQIDSFYVKDFMGRSCEQVLARHSYRDRRNVKCYNGLHRNDVALMHVGNESLSRTLTCSSSKECMGWHEQCFVYTKHGFRNATVFKCPKSLTGHPFNKCGYIDTICLNTTAVLKKGDSGSPIYCQRNNSFYLRGVLSMLDQEKPVSYVVAIVNDATMDGLTKPLLSD